MNQQELEEFAQFLRMAEMSGGAHPAAAGYNQSRMSPSFWSTFQAKTAISVSMFASAIFLFRNFGHTLI